MGRTKPNVLSISFALSGQWKKCYNVVTVIADLSITDVHTSIANVAFVCFDPTILHGRIYLTYALSLLKT